MELRIIIIISEPGLAIVTEHTPNGAVELGRFASRQEANAFRRLLVADAAGNA